MHSHDTLETQQDLHGGGGDDNIAKRFEAMCLLVSADSEKYSGIWDKLKNSTLLSTEITQRL